MFPSSGERRETPTLLGPLERGPVIIHHRQNPFNSVLFVGWLVCVSFELVQPESRIVMSNLFSFVYECPQKKKVGIERG
jgi:hypothetical protein